MKCAILWCSGTLNLWILFWFKGTTSPCFVISAFSCRCCFTWSILRMWEVRALKQSHHTVLIGLHSWKCTTGLIKKLHFNNLSRIIIIVMMMTRDPVWKWDVLSVTVNIILSLFNVLFTASVTLFIQIFQSVGSCVWSASSLCVKNNEIFSVLRSHGSTHSVKTLTESSIFLLVKPLDFFLSVALLFCVLLVNKCQFHFWGFPSFLDRDAMTVFDMKRSSRNFSKNLHCYHVWNYNDLVIKIL